MKALPKSLEQCSRKTTLFLHIEIFFELFVLLIVNSKEKGARVANIFRCCRWSIYIYVKYTVCTMNNTIRKGKNKSSVTLQYISVFVCHRDCAGHTRTV